MENRLPCIMLRRVKHAIGAKVWSSDSAVKWEVVKSGESPVRRKLEDRSATRSRNSCVTAATVVRSVEESVGILHQRRVYTYSLRSVGRKRIDCCQAVVGIQPEYRAAAEPAIAGRSIQLPVCGHRQPPDRL